MNLIPYVLMFQPARSQAGVWESLAIWGVTGILCLVILWRYIRQNTTTQRRNLYEQREAEELKINKPPAQHPMVNLNQCIGCGSCVDACPEGGVLGMVNGKAAIINGLRCVGHGRCAEACPVEAIHIGLGDISNREDLPQLDEDYQTNIPGIYIVGELGGLALVKNAIRQGEKAVQAIARDMQPGNLPDVYDLIIVGGGPAGLSASLSAKRAGLSALILEQEDAGGTILQYPRKKMMLTQPVEIPLYGWLKKPTYYKEELLDIWNSIIMKQKILISRGEVLDNIHADGEHLRVLTSRDTYTARRVILALGRRGTPRKLGAPGEDKAKVMYKLMDAQEYQNEQLLVVGGGDSAVEAAIALAQQSGNTVTLSYRKHQFFRIKKRNRQKLDKVLAEERLHVVYNSQVETIEDSQVRLATQDGPLTLANDYVFIFAGGIPPFGLLKKIGIAFGGPAEAEAAKEKVAEVTHV